MELPISLFRTSVSFHAFRSEQIHHLIGTLLLKKTFLYFLQKSHVTCHDARSRLVKTASGYDFGVAISILKLFRSRFRRCFQFVSWLWSVRCFQPRKCCQIFKLKFSKDKITLFWDFILSMSSKDNWL